MKAGVFFWGSLFVCADRLALGHCVWVWVLPVPVALVGDGGKEKKAISGTIKKAEKNTNALFR